MSGRPVLIRATATAAERAALLVATQRIAQCLATTPAAALQLACEFAGSPSQDPREPDIVIESMLPEVDSLAEPWPACEARLRARLGELARQHRLLYLVTAFRVIGGDAAPAMAAALRVRIRRLNRLAIELSRETGAALIDVDRSLADLGAHTLATDHRLDGPFATEAVTRCLAQALLATAFDDHVSATDLDAAQIHLARLAVPWPDTGAALADAARLRMVTVRSAGGRAQSAQFFSNPESRIGQHLRGLASGQIGLWDGVARLYRAIRHHGARRCAALLWHGFTQRPGGRS
ncbi:hypothetical protein BH10PSE17_BH10PSE17_25540 [soil metagenome]